MANKDELEKEAITKMNYSWLRHKVRREAFNKKFACKILKILEE